MTNSGTTNLQIKANLPAGAFALADVVAGGGSCLGGTTGLNLAPGSSCTLSVAFKPTSVGAALGSVTLYGLPATGLPGTYTAYPASGTGVVKAMALSGSGVALSASVSPTSLSFGNVESGSSKYLKSTVTNTSTVPITVVPAFSGAPEFSMAPYLPLLSDACARNSDGTWLYRVLLPGENCDVEVLFQPLAAGLSLRRRQAVDRSRAGRQVG